MDNKDKIIHNCPGCGTPVKVWSSREGTSHYEPVKDKRIESLEAELNEQARLHGMGAEREAGYLGKIERLERENARSRGALEKYQEAFLELDCSKGIDLYQKAYEFSRAALGKEGK